MWSSPRNISTALMYSFAQRSDMTVVDEPLYAHYLTHSKTEARHPATIEILQTQNANGVAVVEEVVLGSYPTPHALFKQMTHHLIELDRAFLAQTDNILLIRDPRAIIASYTKVIPNPTIADIGVAMQLELFQQLQELGTLRAVLDTKALLMNPEGVLRQLCNRLGLPFEEQMLFWEAGARPEDGSWAKYWYHNVHQSTGFKPYQPKAIQLPNHLIPLAEACQPYYDELFEEALKA